MYIANETEGNGEGLYEFRPLQQKSQLYSSLKSVETKAGNYSGMFQLFYEDSPQNKNETPARLTISVFLSSFSEFIKFEVTLNEIPLEHHLGNRENQDF